MTTDSNLLAWARRQGLSAKQAARLLARARRASRQSSLADTATSFLHCCDRWWPVVRKPGIIPRCPRCQIEHLVTLKRSALDARGIDYGQ